jgi:ACT domain-containing protein
MLEILREGKNIAQACNELKITRQTYYSYRHNVAGFADEVDGILEGRPTSSQLQSAQTKQALLDALTKYKGIVTDACKEVGIGRPQYYNHLNDPEFAAAVKDIQEQVLDFAETRLYSLINQEHPQATMFLLKTRGRSRGYGDQVAITGADGGPIQVRVIEPFVDPLLEAEQQLSDGTVVDGEYEVLEPV